VSASDIAFSPSPFLRLLPFFHQLQGLDRKSILHRIQLENFQTSTKLEALLEELHSMQARDPSAKAIVFSQFVNMLDLIMWRMTADGTKVTEGGEGGYEIAREEGRKRWNGMDV